ncbi:MAG: LysR substrate-binding domain-containing protein [Bacteroidales bacterium]|nr:LysR substrate-binding domain-containing protein [Bacteroidales bacterium]
MTLQQLEYIVAVDKHRSFVQAAESCGVTQSTLSTLVQKLENELDVVIFDRNSRPVKPTEMGEKLINQAKVALFNVNQLDEMVQAEKKSDSGEINMSISPTIAPYITPKLFKYMSVTYPNIRIRAHEMSRNHILYKLKRAEIDLAILSYPHEDEDLLEIPLYHEKFVAYVSPMSTLYKEKVIDMKKMPSEHLWGLREDVSLQRQVSELCDLNYQHSSKYEAGGICTVMMIVDENGGYTCIPELHVNLLRESMRAHIRPVVNPEPSRTVSIFVRKDFVRERMLNILAEAIKHIIPIEMIDERILKYPIRL